MECSSGEGPDRLPLGSRTGDAVIGFELPDAGLTGQPADLVATARSAEATSVDYLVLPDQPATANGEAGPPAAMVTAAWLAAMTDRIGLVVTASTAYHEPYNLARLVASLDHISGGRAGWRVTAAPDALADRNHRREGTDPAGHRDARAIEYVPLVRDLWDSWEDGAFVHDKATGQFIDPHRIRTVDHAGPALSVRGPLNLARPPQGHPVVFAAAADPLLAPVADVLTVGDPATREPGPGDGRPRMLTVLAFVGETGAQAVELHARAGAPRGDHERSVVVGDPDKVAKQLSAWVGTFAGYTVRFPSLSQVTLFTEAVLPRLRPAVAPAGMRTLRHRLGLARPANGLAERVRAASDVERS